MSRVFTRLSGVLCSLLLIAAPIVAFTQRQAISDWYVLRDYTAPSAIAQLADATTMTDQGRRLFYVNKPSLEGRETFSGRCHQGEESIVLGCFIEDDGIYLYNVQDPRLKGVLEVTAAHEMLHAAYSRLGEDERIHIDNLLKDVYRTVTNERIKATVARYEANDASVVPNELHSILGTELTDLSPELETYYRQYFSNRTTIVKLSEQYEQEFATRQAQVTEYDNRMEALKNTISQSNSSLAAQHSELTSQRDTLNGLVSSGDIETYNSMVGDFNRKVNAYNRTVQTAQSRIDEYNELVEKRNALAVEVQSLVEAIDSRPQSL